LTGLALRGRLREAATAWLARSESPFTRRAYGDDLAQFFSFHDVSPDDLEFLVAVRPEQVAAWRDSLRDRGATNATITRKMTAMRSLFSYSQTYGYTGANPAHSKFVKSPPVSKEGKTGGLTPKQCRLLLDAPGEATPERIRDRAMLGTLAYTACRVGEIVRLTVGSYSEANGHRVLRVLGKGNKERRVPLHPEAWERIEHWLDVSRMRGATSAPLFLPLKTPRGAGWDGFAHSFICTRAVQRIVEKYLRLIGLPPHFSVHSLRVTALTTARNSGCDLIDLQDFAGHSDPRTTLAYYAQSVEMCSKCHNLLIARHGCTV
jgi:integrase/recombinase XerD